MHCLIQVPVDMQERHSIYAQYVGTLHPTAVRRHRCQLKRLMQAVAILVYCSIIELTP
jgi:hypothetical protein